MDQVKVALAILKKHHFWVLVVIVVIVGGAVWAMAASDLAKRFETRKTDIEGKRTAVLGIPASPPNQKLVDAIKKRDGLLKENVLAAWELLYKEQKKNNPWPEELGEEFLMVINSLGPKDEIPQRYRETYLNFISSHLPRMDDIIDRRKPKNAPAGTAMGAMAMPGMAMPGMADPGMMGTAPGMAAAGSDAEMAGKTFWDDAEMVKQGFTWGDRVPETIQVRTAQEDLWVYEALLRIIKNTNTGASHHYNAAVKAIEQLQIGRAAAAAFQQSANRLKVSGSPTGGGMGMGAMPGGDPAMMAGDPAMMAGSPAMPGGDPAMMAGDPAMMAGGASAGAGA
ncbi:MAG: hypothetical protein HUU20_05140, partial [Pirellulales bacterium]|nr:hypothetical protein [Pirellulales bacterium]